MSKPFGLRTPYIHLTRYTCSSCSRSAMLPGRVHSDRCCQHLSVNRCFYLQRTRITIWQDALSAFVPPLRSAASRHRSRTGKGIRPHLRQALQTLGSCRTEQGSRSIIPGEEHSINQSRPAASRMTQAYLGVHHPRNALASLFSLTRQFLRNTECGGKPVASVASDRLAALNEY